MTETRTDLDTLVDDAAALDPGAGSKPPKPPVDPDALRAEIELTRAQLADTVAALAAKTDVKSRVREGVSATSEQIRSRLHEVTGHARQSLGDRVSAATHSLHRGGHRANGGMPRPAEPPAPGTAELAPPGTVAAAAPGAVAPVPGPEPGAAGGRRVPTVAAGAVGGALIGLLVYLVWRGRR